MAAQMMHSNSVEQGADNFLLLKHRPIFTVALYAAARHDVDGRTFIANGRYVSSREIEVWILDGSELAECVRTESGLFFEIEAFEGFALRGSAIASIRDSRIGRYERRYVEARLTLEKANVEAIEYAPMKWLT